MGRKAGRELVRTIRPPPLFIDRPLMIDPLFQAGLEKPTFEGLPFF